MKRRDFLKAMLVAPAVVRAESLMKINPAGLLVPDDELWRPIENLMPNDELTIEDIRRAKRWYD